MEHLSKEISENQRIVEERLRGCDDILLRPIMLGKDRETACFLIYIETAVSNLMLEDSVIGRFLNGLRSMEQAELYETLEKDGMGLSDTGKLWVWRRLLQPCWRESGAFADGLDFAQKIGSKGYPGKRRAEGGVGEGSQGLQRGFLGIGKNEHGSHKKTDSEHRLKVKETPLGESSHTMAALLYMEDLVYPPFLKAIEKKMGRNPSGRCAGFRCAGAADGRCLVLAFSAVSGDGAARPGSPGSSEWQSGGGDG